MQFLIFLAGVAMGAAIVALVLSRGRAIAAAETARLQTLLEQERKGAGEKLKLLEDSREQLTLAFKQLSGDILEEKSRRFAEQNQQSLDSLLKPLGEKIATFERQVKQTYEYETRDRVALKEQIVQLQLLNQQVSVEANQLSTALRGQSKSQGNWGEMILERILELSGLAKGREYETQFSAHNDDGARRRPDAVVHLPDNRDIVIDAKVSLKAYLRATEATSEADRIGALAEHVAAVRAHLHSLSVKEYQNLEGIRTLDFVLMFVPSEAAYIEAIRAEPRLFEEALTRNVGLVSPSTLLPTLRTVENLWRFERQGQNAMVIAERAGRLYDKFAGFLEDLDKVGRGLETTGKAYQTARNKLLDGAKGTTLMDRVEELRSLGAKTSKQLPLPAVPRAPAAPDAIAEDTSD